MLLRSGAHKIIHEILSDGGKGNGVIGHYDERTLYFIRSVQNRCVRGCDAFDFDGFYAIVNRTERYITDCLFFGRHLGKNVAGFAQNDGFIGSTIYFFAVFVFFLQVVRSVRHYFIKRFSCAACQLSCDHGNLLIGIERVVAARKRKGHYKGHNCG